MVQRHNLNALRFKIKQLNSTEYLHISAQCIVGISSVFSLSNLYKSVSLRENSSMKYSVGQRQKVPSQQLPY